jgi:hypothetical protein
MLALVATSLFSQAFAADDIRTAGLAIVEDLSADLSTDFFDARRRAGVRMGALGVGECRTPSGGAGTYIGYRTVTQEKCRALCLADPRCVGLGFTFESAPCMPGWCKIHTETVDHVVATTVYTKDNQVFTGTTMCEYKVGAVPSTEPEHFARMSALGNGRCRTSTGVEGAHHGIQADTQEFCRLMCMSDPECLGLEFTYKSAPSHGGFCKLFTEKITNTLAGSDSMCESKVVRSRIGRRLEGELEAPGL